MNRRLPKSSADGRLCEICGNEIGAGTLRCPFCNSRQASGAILRQGESHRLINLEQGMPLVEQALKRLESEIRTAEIQSVAVLTVIHGYGSSGRGGRIRREVRRQLEFMKARQRINDFITGEEFAGRIPRIARLLRRFPFLAGHADLNRANRGITLVILKKTG